MTVGSICGAIFISLKVNGELAFQSSALPTQFFFFCVKIDMKTQVPSFVLVIIKAFAAIV
jgi:hypothetical protein